MDGTDNLYNFEDTFENKLQKVVTTNQNSISLVTGLYAQNKKFGTVNNDNEPIGLSSLTQSQQPGRGQRILFSIMVSRSSKTSFDKPTFSIDNGNFALSLTSKNTLYYYKAIVCPEGLGGLPKAERLRHSHMN